MARKAIGAIAFSSSVVNVEMNLMFTVTGRRRRHSNPCSPLPITKLKFKRCNVNLSVDIFLPYELRSRRGCDFRRQDARV